MANAQTLRAIAIEAMRVAGLEDATDAEKETAKNALKAFNDANNDLKVAVTNRRKLLLDNRVAERQEETDAENKRKEDRKKASDEARDAAVKAKKEEIEAVEKARKETEERLKKEAEEFFEKGKQSEIDAANLKLEQEKILADGIVEINKNSDETIAYNKKLIDDKAAADKKILRDQEIALTGATFGKVAELLGKNSKVGKAFAISQALINTYQGITAELATKAATPFEFGVKLVNIASVAAIGFKAVKNIISTKADGGGGGAPSIGSAGGGAGGGGAQAPSFNVVGNSGVNQIAQTLGQPQPPIQAVVVANNVTTAQSANRNIVQNASLG
jgi:hypothetical protein